MSVFLYEAEAKFLHKIIAGNPVLGNLGFLQRIPLLGKIFQDEDLNILIEVSRKAKEAVETQERLEITEDEAFAVYEVARAAVAGGSFAERGAEVIVGGDWDGEASGVARSIVRKLQDQYSWIKELD